MEISMNVDTLWGRWTYEKCVRDLAEAGFTAIDYSMMDFHGENPVFMTDDYKNVAEEKRKIARNAGLNINQTHAPYKLNFADPEYLQAVVMPRMKRAIEVSALLGAKTTVVHPLHYMVYAGNEQKIFDMNMKFFRELIPSAEKFGITLCVENMFQRDALRGCPVADVCSTAKEFVSYVDTLNHPLVKACLDTGHCALPYGGDEAAKIARALGYDRLKALHIQDNDCKNDQHLAPFAGKLNWTEIMTALGEIDYCGDFTYEFNWYAVPDDADFLPNYLKYLVDTAKYLIRIIDRHRPKK